jgi:hypothetical protein
MPRFLPLLLQGYMCHRESGEQESTLKKRGPAFPAAGVLIFWIAAYAGMTEEALSRVGLPHCPSRCQTDSIFAIAIRRGANPEIHRWILAKSS